MFPFTLERLVATAVDDRKLYPLLYVVSGSRGYEMHTPKSDWDDIGIHLSNGVLDHPRYRKDTDVQEWKDLEFEGNKVSIVSYEAWKYMDLLRNGAFTAYEIQDLQPALYYQPKETNFQFILRHKRRDYVSTAFIYSALGNAKSDMFKNGLSHKKLVMGYYRLAQAAMALHDGKLTHHYSVIHDCHYYCSPIPTGRDLLDDYLKPETRNRHIGQELENFLRDEVSKLVHWIDSTAITRRNQPFPEDRLQELLKALKGDRIDLLRR